MSTDNFRISFQVIAFTKGLPVSPERIEQRLLAHLEQIVFDARDLDSNRVGETVFGYVQNMKVIRNDP